MYEILRPFLFRRDAEDAHHAALRALRLAGRSSLASTALRALFELEDPRLEVEAFGLRFKNPIGLAAGYDKNADAVAGLECLGFGHLEVGTVTLRAQPGNERPRVFRLIEDRAVINRMGLPSRGIDALGPIRPNRARIGINIGKGRDTPPERAAAEYGDLLRRAHGKSDYVAINVSSPNTPGLRALQSRAAFEELLGELTSVRSTLSPYVPILVKVAPDLTLEELDAIVEVILAKGIDGVIATNTSTNREGLREKTTEMGGLSGRPLATRSNELIAHIARVTKGRLPIIGVGGVFGPEDALEKLRSGAWLVQLFTGLVFEGPGLPKRILEGLLDAIEESGVSSPVGLRGTPGWA
ncbi:MAG: quinone-dependent dihydroorotate dehydrogenase [Deltaproteobacteria bacterium]|nr:quinone-dependent dihydroorotate dehydrogenase [Deltaproteobacteria bacterium]